jgi:hypothetical protein
MSLAAAREIIDEAKSFLPCRKANPLAAWLGLTYLERFPAELNRGFPIVRE